MGVEHAIMCMMASIDLTDQQLIRLLAEDARQTSEALAKQLGVNPSTVRHGLQKLTKDGVIRIVAHPKPKRIELVSPLASYLR